MENSISRSIYSRTFKKKLYIDIMQSENNKLTKLIIKAIIVILLIAITPLIMRDIKKKSLEKYSCDYTESFLNLE